MKKALLFATTLIATTLAATSAMAYAELNCKDIYRGNETAIVISKDKVSGYNLRILRSKYRGTSNEGKLGFTDGPNLIAETSVKTFTDREVGKEYMVRTDFEGYTHLKCVVTVTDFRDR